MTQEEFNVVFELQMRKCADILAHKKKEYTGDNIDRLSAFKIAAALQNCDPKAALAGMMSKHVVSLIRFLLADTQLFALCMFKPNITPGRLFIFQGT